MHEMCKIYGCYMAIAFNVVWSNVHCTKPAKTAYGPAIHMRDPWSANPHGAAQHRTEISVSRD